MMSASQEFTYWMSEDDWSYIDEPSGQIKLTDKAPQRAVISFEKWKKRNGISY